MQENNNKFEKEIKTLSDQYNSIDRKLEKVMIVLVGEDLSREGGFVSRVISLEEKVDKLERLIDKTKFFFMGATVFGGYGVFELIKNLLANIK